MRYDLEDLKASILISDVIGSRVEFDRRKSRRKGDHWFNCPFHGENTPSAHCDDDKGRYYCFGCGAKGDHFGFIMEYDGVQFPQAVEIVANLAGREARRESKPRPITSPFTSSDEPP